MLRIAVQSNVFCVKNNVQHLHEKGLRYNYFEKIRKIFPFLMQGRLWREEK